MNIAQAMLEKIQTHDQRLEVLAEQSQVLAEKTQDINLYIQHVTSHNKAVKWLKSGLVDHQSETVKAPEPKPEPKTKQKFPHNKLAVILKSYFDKHGEMPRHELLSILKEEHELEWVNFSEVITSLKNKDLLFIDTLRKHGTIYYALAN
ncbi:hypothetical protein [Peribacillus sp. CSMR9]|uniref:hypothetical protein n=1 Tax=Peribacillus sp. CSMR9 TaxID=2981350 RepID=UPI002954797D|nr:hypothetical protein [Peribacillus sp. CSMR9]MDV7767550.1 hypothetical protein [Peribacillus sp. CSMR9]